MDFCYFSGIDIAKDTLDWAVYSQQGIQFSTHTDNTTVGIKTALTQFKTLTDWNPQQAVFCMEHTARAAPWHLQRPSAGSTLPSQLFNLAGVVLAD